MVDVFGSILHRQITRTGRVAAWIGAIAVLVLLGWLRATTDAEYAFASIMIIPVVAIAWWCGGRDGLALALLAALAWTGADLMADRPVRAHWIHVLNGTTRLATYALVAHLVARVRSLLDLQHSMASHDALTGLLNRRAFMAAGEEEVARSIRYGHPMAVMFLDLDDFKGLNDSRGHEAGDRALQAVARALEAALRATDRVARLGGDEFAVLLPEISYAAASEATRKLGTAIDLALASFSPLSASIGVAWFGEASGSFSDIVKAADHLMYEVKQSGKHAVLVRRVTPASSAGQDQSG